MAPLCNENELILHIATGNCGATAADYEVKFFGLNKLGQ